MSWFSHIGAKPYRFEVELLVQTVRYKNLSGKPLYVVWARNEKEQTTRPVSETDVKGVYDFLDSEGSPPDPQPPLKFACTMYVKKDKFVSKKSKIYLRYKAKSSDEVIKLGVAELDIAEHLDAKNMGATVQETLTLSFLKSVDKHATITCQLRARWQKEVDVNKLREEDPDAVSRASGISGFVSQVDDHSQLHPHDGGDVDEPEDNEQFSPEATAARFRRNMSPQSSPGDGEEEVVEDDGTGIGDFVDETPEERAARKAAKKAKKEAKAKKKAEAARRAANEEATDDEADAVEDADATSNAYSDLIPGGHAVGPSSVPVAATAATVAPVAARQGSIKAATPQAAAAAAATTPVASKPIAAVPVAAAPAVAEEEEEAEDPQAEWTNFTGTLPYIMMLQNEEAPELDIPQPLHKLLKALKKLGGYETELIFKRGPTEEDLVTALKERIEGGVYKLKTDDPRVPAAAIKLWLSSLAIPLFPPAIHSTILKIGSMDDVDPAEEEARRQRQKEEEEEEEAEEEEKAAKKSKQAALAADLYSDIVAGLSPLKSPNDSDASSSSAAHTHENVAMGVQQVIAAIPEVHRRVLHALVEMIAKLLEPKNRKKNMHDSASLSVIFGDLFTRLQPDPSKKQYEFFLDRQYANKFVEYLVKYREILDQELPDVPYPEVPSKKKKQEPVKAAAAVAPQPLPQEDYSDIIGAPAQAPTDHAAIEAALHAPVGVDPSSIPVASVATPQQHPQAAAASAAPPQPEAAAAAEVVEEEEEEEDEEEKARKERKRLKKEAKRLKKEKRQKEEEEEDGEEQPEDATPPAPVEAATPATPATPAVAVVASAPIATITDQGLMPLPGLTPSKPTATHATTPASADPFGDLILPSTPVTKQAVVDPTHAAAAAQPSPASSLESFSNAELVDETEEEREVRLAAEARAAKKAAKAAKKQREREEEERRLALEEAELNGAVSVPTAAAVAPPTESYDDLLAGMSEAAPPAETTPPAASTAPVPTPSKSVKNASSSSPSAIDESHVHPNSSEADATRIAMLQHLLQEKDKQIADREAQISDRDRQLAKAHERIEALEREVQTWKRNVDEVKTSMKAEREAAVAAAVSAATASAAATAAASSPSPSSTSSLSTPSSKDAETRIRKLEKKLAKANEENEELLQQSESLAKQVALLTEISQEKSHAADVLGQQLALSSTKNIAGVAPTTPASPASAAAAATPTAAAAAGGLKPVAQMSPSEIQDLVDSLKARLATDDSVLGLGIEELGEEPSKRSAVRGRRISNSISTVTDALAKKEEEIRRLNEALHAKEEELEVSRSVSETSAQKFEELEATCIAEKAQHAANIDAANAQIKEADARRKDAEKKLQAAEQKAQDSEAQVQEAQAKTQAAESKLQEAESQLHEAEALVAASQAAQLQLAGLQSENEQLSVRLHAAEQSASSMRTQAESSAARAHEQELQLSSAQADLKIAQANASKAQEQFQALQQEHEETVRELEEKRAKVKELIAANEKRTLATPTAAAAAAAAVVSTPASRRRASRLDSESDSDEDEAMAARRARRQALAAATGSPAASPAAAAVGAESPSAADIQTYQHLLAEKNLLIADHEANETKLKSKIESLESEKRNLESRVESLETEATKTAAETRKSQSELNLQVKNLQRELDDVNQRAATLIQSPRKPSPSPQSNGKSSSGAAASTEEVEALHAHINQLDMSIQGYLAQIASLEESKRSLESKIASTPSPSISKKDAEKLLKLTAERDELAEQVEELKMQVAKATATPKTFPVAAAAPSVSSVDQSEFDRVQAELKALENHFDTTLELHAQKVSQLESDHAAKLAVLQKFKAALGEKYAQLDAENATLRARALQFASLNEFLEKKYTDASARKKLDSKELTLLQAYHQQERRTQFLESQLKSSDETLRLTRDTFNETNVVLEQELEGLELENDNLKELYKELQRAMQLGVQTTHEQQVAAKQTNGVDKFEYREASLVIDWTKYEDAKLKLAKFQALSNNLNVELTQLHQRFQTRTSELEELRSRIKVSEGDNTTLKNELVRTGITLETIANDNYEMKGSNR